MLRSPLLLLGIVLWEALVLMANDSQVPAIMGPCQLAAFPGVGAFYVSEVTVTKEGLRCPCLLEHNPDHSLQVQP